MSTPPPGDGEPAGQGPPGGAARVGPYTLLQLLGAGGMGEVHLARADDGRHVALKLVHPEFAADDRFRARFRQEVDAAGKVLSFFTVPLVDAGPDDTTPWLATQYVTGPSLEQAVRSGGPLPLSRLCTLAAALGEALVVIHAADIVHRDLKPSNVLLAEDGPRVIDFGIARAAEATDLTGTGMVVGTLGYASPEQLIGEDPVGPANDVYSLGAVLLFAATGRPPFADTPAAALAYRTVYETPDTTGVPPALLPLVQDCLAREPAQRPTPSQVIAAARAAQSLAPPDDGQPAPPARDGGETTSYPLAPPPRQAAHVPTAPGAPPARPPGRLRSLTARPGYLAGLAAGLVVAVLAAVGVALLPYGGEEPPGPGPTSSTSPDGNGPDGNGPDGKSTERKAAPPPEGPAADGYTDLTAAGDRERAWRSPLDGTADERSLTGSWLTEHAAARTGPRGTRGLDPATGELRWTVPPPKGTEAVCAASLGRSATADGIGAVLYGDPADDDSTCTTVGAVDTRNGELLWHQDIGSPSTRRYTVGMSGGSLVTAGEEGLLGLDPHTGKERWQRTDGIDDCNLTDALTGPRTVTVLEVCGNASSPDTVVEIDSATGEERWRFTLPRNVTHALPVTAEPASVSLGRGGDGSKDALLVFDRSGKHHHEIPETASFGELSIAGDEHAAFPRVAAHGDTVMVSAQSPEEALDDLLLAVDTRTGDIRWREEVPFGSPLLLGLDDDSVTVLAAYGERGDEVRLVDYALDDAKLLGEGSLPAEFADPEEQRVIADGTRVVQFIGRRATGAAAYRVPEGL